MNNLNAKKKIKALICDIQRFSVHDGPGIRTTVFFKGCPLRCLWCQNPEALRFENELVFSPEKCIACGDCAQVCPSEAIEFKEIPIMHWERCRACFACAEVCPTLAREPAGKEYTPEQLAEEVLKDREFFGKEGGVTLSGGEPFSHPAFLRELLPLLKKEKIHITAETCGYFPWKALEEVLSQIDLILFDLKALTPELHQKLTGKSNELILENLKKILERKIPHQIRTPLIPGYNDREDELKKIAHFLKELGEKEIWLLPYHRLGESKLKKLDSELKPLGIKPMSDSELKNKAQILVKEGLQVKTFKFTLSPD